MSQWWVISAKTCLNKATASWSCPQLGTAQLSLFSFFFFSIFRFLSNSSPSPFHSSPSQTDKELTLFSPCHNNKKNSPTKIYHKEVHYRLEIWHIDSTHKIKTLATIPRMVTHHPKDSHPLSLGWAMGTHHAQDDQIPLPGRSSTQPFHVWSPTISRVVNHHAKDSHHHQKGNILQI